MNMPFVNRIISDNEHIMSEVYGLPAAVKMPGPNHLSLK